MNQKRFGRIGVAAALTAGVAFADFSYKQSSQITGGFMKSLGTFSKQLREPMESTILIKGDRMATIDARAAHIVDLAKETITDVNFDRKTYSVITFAQMADALKQLDAKMKDDKGNAVGNMTFKVSVRKPGDTRQINGMTAQHAIMTVEFQGTDQKTGQTGTFMTMISDMWLAPEVAGYAEVKDFHQRMASKVVWAPGSGMMSMATPGGTKGMAEIAKETSKLDGVPVLQVVKMTFGTPEQAEAAAKQQSQQQPQQAEAEKPSAGGALGRLAGGRLGGLGGFGRKKKQEEPQAASSESAPMPQQAGGGAPGALMEITSESSGFSQQAVDASKFEVPAGFKQVESEMLRQSRR